MIIHFTQSMGKWYWTILNEYNQEVASCENIGTSFQQASTSAHSTYSKLNTEG